MMSSVVDRRRFLRAGLLAGGGVVIALSSGSAIGQALPSSPVPVPYYPTTRTVTFPTAANDNLAAGQRLMVNRQMTKTAIGMKSGGLGLARTNRALRAIGSIARVARVGGFWGLVASFAIGYGIDILLGDGNLFRLGSEEGQTNGSVTIPAGSNVTTYLMTFPYFASLNDLPMGMTTARNAATNPTQLTVYYKVDISGTVTPQTTLGEFGRQSVTYIAGPPAINRTVYSRNISVAQLESGVVVAAPPLPTGAINTGLPDTLTVPAQSADTLDKLLVQHALALDAAAAGSGAAIPGYIETQPLPFPWANDLPSSPPQTLGDWKAPIAAIPSSVDPATHPWELSQSDYDALPTVNPETGLSTNPNPGQTTDPAGNPLPIQTGPEVTPENVQDLPPFEKFVAPFRNAFDPFKAVYGAGSPSCPAFTMNAVPFPPFGTIGGQSFDYHCQLIEPLRPVIVAASTAAGGWAAISHILEA